MTGQNLFTPYLFYAYILSYYLVRTLPTFTAKAAGFPAAMLISLAQFFLPALE